MDRTLRAVWATSRSAIRRRRLQTVVVGVVIFLCTTTVVIGATLLVASSSPFDKAFAAVRGADLTATVDTSRATGDQLAATTRLPGVTAAAGPYATKVVSGAHFSGLHDQFGGPGLAAANGDAADLVVVGRADRGGPVDRLTVRSGHWLSGPGQIVLAVPQGVTGPDLVGARLTLADGSVLKVVGTAISITGSAAGWVTPAQMAAMRPSRAQLLYRLDTGTAAATRAVTAALPAGAVLGTQTAAGVRHDFQLRFNEVIPFVTIFGALSLVLSVLIIGSAVSGAVVSGYRHIGIMKSIGFTPGQVTTVYLAMILVPALVGCVLGLAVGDALALMLSHVLAEGYQLPPVAGIGVGVDLVAVLLILAVVLVSAVVPATRAGRLPTVEAISARAGSRTGRGRRVQRALARSGLPRPVALGLSLPFARPGRTLLTLAIVFVGATSVVFAAGLHNTVQRISADSRVKAQVDVFGSRNGTLDLTTARQLRTRPGVAAAMAENQADVMPAGGTARWTLEGFDGDVTPFLSDQLLTGRLFERPGEVMADEGLLKANGLHLGDSLRLVSGAHSQTVRIVGVIANPDNNELMGDFATAAALDSKAVITDDWIRLRPGVTAAAFLQDLPGSLEGVPNWRGGGQVVFDALFALFTLIIGVTAGLGVLNTVLLTSRDRARDLGILKALGMTPRQVRLLVITSAGATGLLAGLVAVPAGIAVHHSVIRLTGDLIDSGMRTPWVHVYSVPLVVALALAGCVIAVVGALLPSVRAGRTPTATALRSE